VEILVPMNKEKVLEGSFMRAHTFTWIGYIKETKKVRGEMKDRNNGIKRKRK